MGWVAFVYFDSRLHMTFLQWTRRFTLDLLFLSFFHVFLYSSMGFWRKL